LRGGRGEKTLDARGAAALTALSDSMMGRESQGKKANPIEILPR